MKEKHPSAEEDVTQPQGLPGFFAVLKREFWGLFGLNLLFFAVSLPVITLPFALGGMYFVLRQMVQDKPTYVWRDFWKGFRANAKQAAGAGLFLLVVCGPAVLGIWYGLTQGKTLALAAGSLVLGVVALCFVYIYTLIVSIELPLSALLYNSFVLAVGQLGKTVLVVLFSAGPLILVGAYLPYSIPAFYLGLFSFTALINCYWAWSSIVDFVATPEPAESGFSPKE